MIATTQAADVFHTQKKTEGGGGERERERDRDRDRETERDRQREIKTSKLGDNTEQNNAKAVL